MKNLIFLFISFLLIQLSVPHNKSYKTIKSSKLPAVTKKFKAVNPTLDSKLENPVNKSANIILAEYKPKLSKVAYTPEGLNADAKTIVMSMATSMFGAQHLEALDQIMIREAHYNPYAVNPNGGACGMFQALPCEKMGCDLGDIECQAKWGLNYIARRYGNPTLAWEFWQENHWY